MRTFSSFSEIPPQSDSPRWMILDGALLPKLDYQIAKLGVELSINIEHFPLLRGTQWDQVSELGPYLVVWSKELESWAHEIAPYRYGVLFESEASFNEIKAHWEKLITCEHIGLEGSLTRLYDPIIFRYLLQQAKETRFDAWMGPMNNLWLPNLFSQEYWHAESSAEIPLVLKETFFNDEEWQSLCDASIAYTAWRLILHIERYFPKKLQSTKQETHSFVLQQLNDLKQLGQINEQLATYYLNIICRLGSVLDKNSLYPEINACLQDIELPLEQRLKQANQLSVSFAQNPRDLVENYQ